MLRRSIVSHKVSRSSSTPMWDSVGRNPTGPSQYVKGSMIGGVPRIYYGWMAPGSITRKRFEKMRNPFVDLDNGANIYYRNVRDPVEALRQEADAEGIRGTDNAIDVYNAYRVVPDLYPEGFQWKHKLNTEYNQWRSNTWVAPDVIPAVHRGRFLCSFQVNVLMYDMRVARFSPKDQRQWIMCCLYVGSGKGIAGYGQGLAPSSAEAKKEAIKNAFENIIAVNAEDEGPLYPIRLNFEGQRVVLYPSSRLIGPLILVDVLCAFGFSFAGVKINVRSTNKPKNLGTKVRGVIKAVEMMRTSTEMAHMRGKIPSSLLSNMFPYLEEIRRRKGMFAEHPKGIDGLSFAPNRVVDNRLPDHLKKNYYDEKYWKDFFAGAPGRLNDERIGMRSDELRALVPATNERLPADLLARRRGSKRRTLSDVLNRAGRSQHTLGSLQIVNPYNDMKLSGHVKSLFHLH